MLIITFLIVQMQLFYKKLIYHICFPIYWSFLIAESGGKNMQQGIVNIMECM
jgi:hypothetical protein